MHCQIQNEREELNRNLGKLEGFLIRVETDDLDKESFAFINKSAFFGLFYYHKYG